MMRKFGFALFIVLFSLVILRGQNGNTASEPLKKLYSAEVFPTKVVNVLPTQNAQVLRNKYVETVDSLVYFVDYTGRSILLSTSAQFFVPNVVTIDGVQTVTGKKSFSDTLNAQKGMTSGGLIDTKGVNTEGSATKAALSLKGVQSEKDTVVSTSLALDGRYGTVGFDCTSGIKEGTFPNSTATVGWYFIIRKEDISGNELVLKDANGVVFYTVKSKMVVIVKNKNGIWARER
jgi:hypothetical protein